MSLFVRKNERREIRRAVKLRCRIMREWDFGVVAEEALDISPSGLLVSTSADLEVGERLLVSFQATELGLWFDSEARVARIVRGRRIEDREGKGAGIELTTLSRVKRLILRGHLRRTPPPVPRRSQRIDWTATVRSLQP